jgi:hypothetical protein
MQDYTDAEIDQLLQELSLEAIRCYNESWDDEADVLYNIAVGDNFDRGCALQDHVLRLMGDVSKSTLRSLSLAEVAWVDYIMHKDCELHGT